MANQPPIGRPWFRLTSLSRMEPQAPAPAPPPPQPTLPIPRVPLLRPAVTPPQAQSQPAAVVAPPPSPPRPLQPVVAPPPTPSPPPIRTQPSPPQQAANGPVTDAQQPPLASPKPTAPSRTPTPPQSPKVILPSLTTMPPSPSIRQPQPATSPRASYPEPEAEPKPVPESQPKSIITPDVNGNGNGNGSIKRMADIGVPRTSRISQVDMSAPMPPSPRREESTASNGRVGQSRKKDEGEMKVITIAGENIGAYMELGSSHRRHHQQLHGKKLQNGQQLHQGKDGESGSEDGKHAERKKEKGTNLSTEGKPMGCLVNSNVQSVNNSILFHSSCTQHSPGVHIALTTHRGPKDTSLHKGHSSLH